MIHVAICDDDKRILEDITAKVQASFNEHEVASEYLSFNDTRKLMEHLQSKSVDILFLDIDMPYFSGMDIAGFVNEQRMKTILIFVTSHDALVYQTFAYRPFGFIRKTHINDELSELVSRIKKELINRKQELTIQKGQEISKILISEIVYIESEGNYLNIYLRDEELRIRDTLSNIEKELAGKEFFRCHKGYLINGKSVSKLRTSEVELKYGDHLKVIPIGRSYEKEIRRKILESIRE